MKLTEVLKSRIPVRVEDRCLVYEENNERKYIKLTETQFLLFWAGFVDGHNCGMGYLTRKMINVKYPSNKELEHIYG